MLGCYFTTIGVSGVRDVFEPAHEIMVLFVLHTLILQMRMRNYPVGLEV